MNSATDQPDAVTTSESMAAVEVWNLNKTYRTGFWMNQKIQSLIDCSLSVNQGETFGLLGPNGAGKTTLLKTLLGIVHPSSGRATLLGHPIGERNVKQKVGYLPENPYFYDYLTAWEFLSFVANVFELSSSLKKQRISQLLDLVELDKTTARKKQLRQYSKGMLQRVGMAQALINDPELVFLDEPMSGLDPIGRYRVRKIILSLKEQGKTIFFNSHVLSDVELICDRIAILARGEILCSGSLDDLLGSADVYQVVVRGGDAKILQDWLSDLRQEEGCWQGYLKGKPQAFVEMLPKFNIELLHLNLARASLEEFFIRQLRERNLTTSK